MARARSPNYPSMPLADAIEAIRPVLVEENRNKMSREVLARQLGYTSLNGRALAKIGALRAYGLIEGSGDDLRVSDAAVDLITAPDGSPDRAKALVYAAFRPTLFSELRGDYQGRPSLENLRHNLSKRGFTQEAAQKAAETYLATYDLVPENWRGYTGGEWEEEEEPVQPTIIPQTPPQPAPKAGIHRAEFPLTEGVASVEFPDSMSEDSYAELVDWLELVKRRAKRSIKSTEQ